MHILVTNDDGVQAPGLLALAQALRSLGKVTVLAPDHNWSSSGHAKTLHRPIRVKQIELEDGTKAMTSDGAPSDCVALALLGFLPEPVDFVVSGINSSPNLGHDITYSGTVTAAMEAAISGLPAISFSLDAHDKVLNAENYRLPARIALQAVELALKQGVPKDSFLNINIPYLPEESIKGFRVTRTGRRIYKDALVVRKDPRGIPYYWIGGEAPGGLVEDGTDIGALAEGYVSVTPVKLDLTAHELLDTLKEWDWPNI
jgi:5'-nucleotidase